MEGEKNMQKVTDLGLQEEQAEAFWNARNPGIAWESAGFREHRKYRRKAMRFLDAKAAREAGEWDSPCLAEVGPMTGNLAADLESIRLHFANS